MSYSEIKELRDRLRVINSSSKDLASMTKSDIKELGTSIGVSLNLSSSKANMISTLSATAEFILYEVDRKNFDAAKATKEVYGV